jgi:hypothetical protein
LSVNFDPHPAPNKIATVNAVAILFGLETKPLVLDLINKDESSSPASYSELGLESLYPHI